MELNGQLVLGWLEEDNPQRGHFRVRPLLLGSGPISPEDQAVYRDDGYVRIVPDKNEQRTFKDRMRKTGSLCVMDLRESPKENGKLRPNKNYAPSKGEKNRYIIYSNAVAAIPAGIFYEVVSDAKVQEGATPQVYARHGGRIHGPVNRENGEDLAGAKPLPPDDARLFSVSMPDGGTRLFYWPAQETKAQPAQADEEIPVSEPAEAEEPSAALMPAEPKTALDLIRELNGRMVASMKGEGEDGRKAPEPVVISQVGTPLYHAVLPPQEESGANHSLAQAVEKSRRDQQEKKPAEDERSLKSSGRTTEEKPARPEKKDQKNKPEKPEKTEKPEKPEKAEKTEKTDKADKQDKAAKTPKGKNAKKAQESPVPKPEPAAEAVLSALRAQVQDLEAERLMAVMNLEKAKADEEAFAREVMEKAGASWKEEEARARDRLEELKAQIEALRSERDELDKQAADLAAQCAVRRTFAAEEAPAKTVRDRLCAALRERGFACEPALAEAMLTAWAASDRRLLCLCPDHPADTRLAAEAFAAALGVQPVPFWDELAGCGESAVVTMTEEEAPLERGMTQLLETPPGAGSGVFVPVIPLKESGEEPADGLNGRLPYPPVREKALREEIIARKSELNAETTALIAQARGICAEGGEPLSLSCVRALKGFLMIAQNWMAGGIQTALDYGMLCYVLPQAEKRETLKKLKPLCELLPNTTALLEKKYAAAAVERP